MPGLCSNLNSLENQSVPHARGDGDFQKVAVWGSCSLLFHCRAYIDSVSLLVGIPGGNRTGIMDFCRAVFKPGYKGAHIR